MTENETPRIWHDSDDEKEVHLPGRRDGPVRGTEYQEELRAVHRKSHVDRGWLARARGKKKRRKALADDSLTAASSCEGSDSDDVDSDPLQSSAALVGDARQSDSLPDTIIECERLPDGNASCWRRGRASVLRFVDTAEEEPRLLVAGQDETLRVFTIDGKTNPLSMRIRLERRHTPIDAAAVGGAAFLVLAGENGLFRVDLEKGSAAAVPAFGLRNDEGYAAVRCRPESVEPVFALLGKKGSIQLCDMRTNRAVQHFKMSGSSVAMDIHPSRNFIYSSDHDGRIYHWDRRSPRPVGTARPETGFSMSQLSVSPLIHDAPVLAIGSSSGFVDLFDIEPSGSIGKLVKSMGNLTTRVSSLAFHPSGQLMAATSDEELGAAKLVHVASRKVFRNFPDRHRDRLGHPVAVAFGDRGGHMAIGNAAGSVRLFELNHFCQR